MNGFSILIVVIIGAIMLWRLFSWINSEREAEGEKPLGCIATIIIAAIIITIWILSSRV